MSATLSPLTIDQALDTKPQILHIDRSRNINSDKNKATMRSFERTAVILVLLSEIMCVERPHTLPNVAYRYNICQLVDEQCAYDSDDFGYHIDKFMKLSFILFEKFGTKL